MEMLRSDMDRHSRDSWPANKWGGKFVYLSVFIVGFGITACVSQGKYEASMEENRVLKQENVALSDQLTEIRKQEVLTPKVNPEGQMTNHQLVRLLGKLAGSVDGKGGGWRIAYKDVPMVVITSSEYNRMRIVSPIRDARDLDAAELTRLLEANFDRALDGRYALYQGNLWSVFLHPLSSLTESELTSALDQVANLVKTYGSTYSSSDLKFQ